MIELTQHEKYLRGEPLTAELAAIRDGKEEPSAWEQIMDRVAKSVDVDQPTRDRPLTRADRAELRDLRNSPGWAIFLMLQKRAMRTHQATASKQSEDGDLRPDAMAETWAHVRLFKRACQELTMLIEAEIAELDREEREEMQK